MAGPNFWLGQSMTQPLAQPKWPSHNTCPAKLAQPKYGPATWPSQNWASSQTLAQPKSGKNWPSQKSGPAIIGPAIFWKKLAQPKFGPAINGPVKFWPSQNLEKIGPAKIWLGQFWLLAQFWAFPQHYFLWDNSENDSGCFWKGLDIQCRNWNW